VPELKRAKVLGVDQLNSICHGLMSKPPGSSKSSSTGRALCSKVKTRSGPSVLQPVLAKMPVTANRADRDHAGLGQGARRSRWREPGHLARAP
jgi:hypothetical protein